MSEAVVPDAARTFVVASDEALVALIERARNRLIVIAPALTQDEGVDSYPLPASNVELFGQGVPEACRVKAPFHDTGETIGIGDAETVHRRLVEDVIVRREDPWPWKRPIAQHKLSVEPLIEIADGVIVSSEGSRRDSGPEEGLDLLDDRIDKLQLRPVTCVFAALKNKPLTEKHLHQAL